MTKQEFLNIYESRLKTIADSYIQKLTEQKETFYNSLFHIWADIAHDFNSQGNLLISELMTDLGIQNSQTIKDGLTEVPVDMYLLQKSFTIQSEQRKEFNEKTISILREALCRDFPDDCDKQGILPLE